MKITVALLPRPEEPEADIAVVIDVLRATSVMATAISAGASRVITCLEIEEAREWKAKLGDEVMLCGERNCQRIEGFDLGNSPSEYDARAVAGRTLVLTTTNGTRAIHTVQEAKRIVTASFLNLAAVVDTVKHAEHVHIVCAGTDGRETGEDTLLAGAMVQQCLRRYSATSLGDDATEALIAWRGFDGNSRPLLEQLRETAGGRNLVRYGFQQDLRCCAAVDSLTVVPEQTASCPPTFASVIASE